MFDRVKHYLITIHMFIRFDLHIHSVYYVFTLCAARLLNLSKTIRCLDKIIKGYKASPRNEGGYCLTLFLHTPNLQKMNLKTSRENLYKWMHNRWIELKTSASYQNENMLIDK